MSLQCFRMLAMIVLGLTAGRPTFAAETKASTFRIRQIILHSRHLGAHGMGYNGGSLTELSQKLTPADIPAMILLLGDTELRVGAQFALASQCEAAISPVREAAMQDEQISALDADDIMSLIVDFSGCTPGTQQNASAARKDIDAYREEQQVRRKEQAKRQAAEDERIQKNALKMLDPNRRKELTRSEREEVFRRSVKALGLENPQTAEQKEMVQRMYRTMVLDEPGTPPRP
jgi:hypothetical protein